MSWPQILGAVLGLLGLIIVWVTYGWPAAIGVFLMIFGNNLERSGR